MLYEVMTNLVSDISSKHGVSLTGDLSFLSLLEKRGKLLAFLDHWNQAFLLSIETRSRRPLRQIGVLSHAVGLDAREVGAAKHFLAPLIERVFDYDGKEHATPDLEAFRDVYQLSSCFAKFGAATITEDMQDKALEGYRADEASVLSSDPEGNLSEEIVTFAKKAIEDLLFFTPTWLDVAGRHGPGAVAEGTRNPAEKFALWHFPRDVPKTSLPGLTHYLNVASPLPSPQDESFDSYQSRMCMVPKKWNKCRSICAEPALLQYCQQALGRELELVLTASRRSGVHNMDIRDQSFNATAALDGSNWYGSWATLDLSSASDLLSMELLKLLWPAEWVSRLCAVRSKRTLLPNGDILELAKFASMGNATTFPVQTITFWALAQAVLQQAGMSASEAYLAVNAYGDDIICPYPYAADIMDTLVRGGLRVNMHKSFYKGSFRESCGLHAYNGLDVTPAYLRTDKYDPEGLVSMCAFANGLHTRGYRNTAEYVFGALEAHLGFRLPYSSKVGQLVRMVTDTEDVFTLNTEAGIPVRMNRYQSGYEAKSQILRPIGTEYLSFRDTGDMWAFVPHSGSDRDRGMRSCSRSKLAFAWVAIR